MTKVVVLVWRLLWVLPFDKSICLLEKVAGCLLGMCLSVSCTALAVCALLDLRQDASRFVLLHLCECTAALPTLEGN